MKKSTLIIVFIIILITIQSCEKDKVIHKNLPEGIWIAKDFYKSFEETNSIIKSKKDFDSHNPVGLRINYQELRGDYLNIGYSFLHSHLINPEVSEFAIKENKDTIKEQGSFKINLSKVESDDSFRTSEIYPFSYEWKSYISYNNRTQTIKLFRPKNERYDTVSIEYTRIDSVFDKAYQFPNPIYYYTRKKLLSGEYMVKDSAGKILTNNLTIDPNGQMNGWKKFENNTIYYSTDVFCGEPVFHDLVLIADNLLKEDGKIGGFGMNRKTNGDIELRRNKISDEIEGEILYELVKTKHIK